MFRRDFSTKIVICNAGQNAVFFTHMTSARTFAEKLLKKADVTIDGSRPQDITVHDERLFNRVMRYGSIGLGEAYMDGWWDANSLDVFIHRVMTAHLDTAIQNNFASIFTIVKAYILNLQSSKRAFKVGEHHYDLGNDLYEAMLDKRMVYTCGYWSSPSTGSGHSTRLMQKHPLRGVCVLAV